MRKTISASCIATALLAAILLSGCTSTLRNKELANVAKDWSLVIRASQVIPVYPLTEDLQPGDVLLVSTPVEQQVTLYKKKGFLPLDQLLVRLYPDGIKDFYRNRYGITDDVTPPEHWQTGADGWSNAPAAAFPPYNFSVSVKKGMRLAIPVQGVPVALGLMNTGSASGSVLIDDAHTYGIDNSRLETQVRNWATTNRTLLRNYEPDLEKSRRKQYQFLRVITRVYVTGKVNISIKNANATDSNLAAGGGLDFRSPTNAKAYAETLATFNQLAKTAAPGGNLSINTMSSRSITMDETFARPLVIGYVGFDLPILEGGRLGGPISTLAQLEQTYPVQITQGGNVSYRLAALSHMYNALEEQGDESKGIRDELDQLSAILPNEYQFTLHTLTKKDGKLLMQVSDKKAAGQQVARKDFKSVLDYIKDAQSTESNIGQYLLHAATAEPEISQLRTEQAAAVKAKRDVGSRLDKEPTMIKAVDFAFFGR